MLHKMRERKEARKQWYIKKYFKVQFDTDSYLICILPTIIFQPWRYRYPNCAVIDVTWLNFHITIGEWKRKNE